MQSYMYHDDAFHFDHGQTLAMTGQYAEAEEALLMVQSEAIQLNPVYLSFLARCCKSIIDHHLLICRH